MRSSSGKYYKCYKFPYYYDHSIFNELKKTVENKGYKY